MEEASEERRALRRQAQRLRRLAADYRASTASNIIPIRLRATPFHFRDPATLPRRDQNPAAKALLDFAAELGSFDRMTAVYDLAIERYGPNSVMGVSAIWSGMSGWAH